MTVPFATVKTPTPTKMSVKVLDKRPLPEVTPCTLPMKTEVASAPDTELHETVMKLPRNWPFCLENRTPTFGRPPFPAPCSLCISEYINTWCTDFQKQLVSKPWAASRTTGAGLQDSPPPHSPEENVSTSEHSKTAETSFDLKSVMKT